MKKFFQQVGKAVAAHPGKIIAAIGTIVGLAMPGASDKIGAVVNVFTSLFGGQ